jgi:hypothetical protein
MLCSLAGMFLLKSGAWAKKMLELAIRPEYDFGMDDWGAPRGEQGNVNILLYGIPGWLKKAGLENFDNSFHCPLCMRKRKKGNRCLAYHMMRYWGYDKTKCDQGKTFRLLVQSGRAQACKQCCTNHNRRR